MAQYRYGYWPILMTSVSEVDLARPGHAANQVAEQTLESEMVVIHT